MEDEVMHIQNRMSAAEEVSLVADDLANFAKGELLILVKAKVRDHPSA